MKILIDNGHGVETPGKRSPDGRLKEYAYTREIANRVVDKLKISGIDALRIVSEETDIPLSVRVARANKIYIETGKQAILVSIHCNAKGSGAKWMDVNGWSVFVSENASQKSKQLAMALTEVAKSKKIKVRQPCTDTLYWISNLCICRDTYCPTVLIENFFQDNEEDVKFLLSEKGKQCVTDIITEGIVKYMNSNRL